MNPSRLGGRVESSSSSQTQLVDVNIDNKPAAVATARTLYIPFQLFYLNFSCTQCYSVE